MRQKLASHAGQRKKFRAIFSKFGKKVNYKGYSEPTILLKDIIECETNSRITDHIWFNYTKGFEEAGIKEGDAIEFDARVKKYTKGYVNRRFKVNNKKTDYKLSNPTKIVVIRADSQSQTAPQIKV